MGYIRVRDFAAENNCTPQNIYKHLRNPNYAAQLDGHVITGPGKQGLLLDDEAQEFLRSIMYPKVITVDSDALAAENAELRHAMLQLGQENLRLATQLTAVEGKLDRATLESGQLQKLLTASQEAKEAQEAEIAQMRNDFAELTQKFQATSEELAQEKTLRVSAETGKQAAEAREAALKNRSWWERLTRKGE